MLRYLFNNSLSLISILADLTSLYITYRLVDSGLNEQGRLGVLFVGIFALIFFAQNLYLRIFWRRKKRYAKAFSLINNGFAELHELERLENPSADKKIQTLEKMLDAMVLTFQQITTQECSACIKVMTKERNEQRAEVITICRDGVSKNLRPIHPYDETPHHVEMNSDFSEICEQISDPSKRHFISNNLPWKDGYRNTRLPLNRSIPFQNIPLLGAIVKLKSWPLQYKSTIVVPILPRLFNTTSPRLAGFLCVDSRSLFAFNEKYDIQILHGISDGMYNIILEYYENLANSN